MMKKEKSSVMRRWAGIMMIPAAAIGVVFLSLPAVARLTEEIRDVAIKLPGSFVSHGKISEKIPNAKIAGAQPSTGSPAQSSIIVAEESMEEYEVANDEINHFNVAEPGAAEGDESSPDSKNGEQNVNASPRYEIDGVLVDETFDMKSLNPNDIKSMTVVKNNPDFPAGLIKIELNKGRSKAKSEGSQKSGEDLLISVKSIDNINGTHLVFQFLTDEEVHLKDVVWTIDGKDYKPGSVSSSFSKSGNHGYQAVKIDLPATITKFVYGKDKISFTRDNGERESFTIPLDMLTPAN